MDKSSIRIALIAKLAEGYQKLGKTVLMKLLYILQEVYTIPLNYNFSLYTYGPYCKDVLNDLDLAELCGLVNTRHIEYSDTISGYMIMPTKDIKQIYNNEVIKSFLSEYNSTIESVIHKYLNYSAKQLELHSTILYLVRKNNENQWKYNDEKIIESVHEVKPRFSISKIEEEFRKIEDDGILRRVS